MKKTLLLIVIFISLNAVGQNSEGSNGQPLGNELNQSLGISNNQLIELTSSTNGDGITSISFDFGQDNISINLRRETLKKGNSAAEMVFTSVVDAINFLTTKGFYLKSYSTTSFGNKLIKTYLFEKFIDKAQYK